MKSFISKIKWYNILLIIFVLSLTPFPTQMIPEWKIQVVDEQNQPLSNVKLRQSWENYTYFFVEGNQEMISDKDGFVNFPPKYLWASFFSRIAFPPLASLSKLAHGSAGTSAYVMTTGDDYARKFTDTWSDNEQVYFRNPEFLPEKIVTNRVSK